MKSKLVLVAVTIVVVTYAFWYGDGKKNDKSETESTSLETESGSQDLPINLNLYSSISNEAPPDYSDDFPSWISDEKRKNLKWPFLCGHYADNLDANESVEYDPKKVEEALEARRREVEKIAVQLSQSDDVEHLLMSGLYGGQSVSQVNFETFSRALEIDDDHPLVAWHVMNACESDSTEKFCLDFDVEQFVLDVDGDNGEVWGKIALQRAKFGNEEEALDAMRRANSAPNFTDYYIEHVQLFERGLAASTSYSEIERYAGAMGFAAALTSSSSAVYGLCKEISIDSHAWRTECLRFGRRMEVDSNTIIGSLIGLALQRQMYELANDWLGVTGALDRESEINTKFKKALWTDTQTVIQHDPRVMSDYLTHWAAHGELSALQFAERETERLKGLPDYNPCEFVATPEP